MLSPALRPSSHLLLASRRLPHAPTYIFHLRPMSSDAHTPRFAHILTSKPDPSVTLITLNRPKALNALSSPLFAELNTALREADADDAVGAVVLTGSEKAFAGALRALL